MKACSYEWEQNFPKGYTQTSLAYLVSRPGYIRAKSGDMAAARRVVRRCVKAERLAMLKTLYPNASLLPVQRRNALPMALAQVIGLPICHSVFLAGGMERKGLSAMERLLHSPEFYGCIIKGAVYVIVDDVVTQGGTVAALRNFVISRGGRVVAVAALAYAAGGDYIAPSEANIRLLNARFGSRLWSILPGGLMFKNARQMTNSQIRYLLSFGNLETMEKKIALCRGKLNSQTRRPA